MLIRTYNFFTYVPVDIVRVFFNFRFSSRKSQSQQNLAKRSVILQYGFTQNTSFPANGFLFVSGKKKICTSPFLDTQELHSSSTLKANVYISVYLLKKMFFQRRSKILAGGMRSGWRLSNFLRAACCLDLVKCFTIFHFN